MAASDMRSSTARSLLQDRDSLTIPSSSPSLPDLFDLGAKKIKAPTKLRSGSAAAPIPSNATNTFTSAADILRAARASGQDDSFDTIDEPDPPPPAAKKPAAKRGRKPRLVKAKETEDENEPTANSRIARKFNKAAKRVAKEVIVLSSDGLTPNSARHDDATLPTPDETEDSLPLPKPADSESTPLKAQPWKKYKPQPVEEAPTEAGSEGSEPAKPAPKTRGRKKKAQAETVSRHFPTKEPLVAEKPATLDKPNSKDKRPRLSTPEPINLEPAVQRRTDWTPPPQDTMLSELDPFDTSVDISTPADVSKDVDATDVFKTLRDTFGHKVLETQAVPAPKQPSAKVLGKRKVIEMVAVNQSSVLDDRPVAGRSPAKEKAVKKKPRTITELAMAAYAQPDASEAGGDEARGGEDSSLLEFFSREVPNQVAPAAENETVTKGKGRATKVTKSKKKAQPKKPVLLSPRAAMKQSAAQDFVFGTSSQLAREQSPTLLRDLHEALKASTIQEEDEGCSLPAVGERRLLRHSTEKRLWSVSARDEEGELVSMEVIDLEDSSIVFPEDDAILDLRQALQEPPPPPPPPPEAAGNASGANSSLIELGSRPAVSNKDKSSPPPSPSPQLSEPKSDFFVTQRKIITIHSAAAAASPDRSEPSLPTIHDLIEYEMPPPSNQQQDLEEVSAPPSKATTAAAAPKPRPKYELFTDATLAKEVSKYGFKPVKSRTGMISLLDQCWKSKSQGLSAGGRAFSTSVLAHSPKRARSGSPKKKAGAVESDDEEARPPVKKRVRRTKAEIAAQAMMPPPPLPNAGPSTPTKKKKTTTKTAKRKRSKSPDSDSESEVLFSPETGDVTITEDTEDASLLADPTAQQTALFAHMTKAITSAPRTTDPETPSWHEKMLMYDPIIVEHLAAWLNSGQLTRVGYDGEVAPSEVKKWCESRSICCLWEKNFRGKDRKRF